MVASPGSRRTAAPVDMRRKASRASPHGAERSRAPARPGARARRASARTDRLKRMSRHTPRVAQATSDDAIRNGGACNSNAQEIRRKTSFPLDRCTEGHGADSSRFCRRGRRKHRHFLRSAFPLGRECSRMAKRRRCERAIDIEPTHFTASCERAGAFRRAPTTATLQPFLQPCGSTPRHCARPASAGCWRGETPWSAG